MTDHMNQSTEKGSFEDLKRTASAAGGSLASAAANTADAAKSKASDAIDAGKSTLKSASETAKNAFSSVASDAKRTLGETIEEQKSAGANAVAGLARSARESADGFESTSPQLANAVRTAADSVESHGERAGRFDGRLRETATRRVPRLWRDRGPGVGAFVDAVVARLTDRAP